MAVQIIPWVVAIVGGTATAAAGVYVYKNYKDSQEPVAPTALVQPAPKPEKVKQPEIKIVKPNVPQFHVLRVEKDGSAVIAGSAPVNTLVEIIHEDKALAKTQASDNGDFAIVFDEPLAPGNYEIYIRATDKDGDSVVSLEAGIISIPERGGELLAMVSKPGEASKLIQVKKTDPAPKTAVKAEPESVPVVKEEPKPEIKNESVTIAKAEPEDKPKVETDTTLKVAPTQAPQPDVKPVVKPTVEIEPNNTPVPTPNPGVKTAPKTETKQVEIASVEKPEPAVKIDPKPEPATVKPVLLEAVEVEGPKIFVAGTGEPGRVVNIYIDNKFLGETVVGSHGSFLLEANSKLELGNHSVRADMLADSSASVVARAEVPLIHDAPLVDKPTIVAKAPDPKPVEVEKSKPETVPETVKVEEAKPESVEVAKAQPAAEKVEEAKPEQVKVVEAKPTAEKVEEAKPEQVKVVEAKPAAEKVEEVKPEQVKVVESKPEAEKVEEAKPEQVKVVEAKPEAEKVEEVKPEQVKVVEAKPEAEKVEEAKPEPVKVAEAKPAKVKNLESTPESEKIAEPKPEPVVVAKASTPEPEVAKAPRRVIRTGSSVIIRRGDNLWHISRRILGRGIRYSTIYEANRNQIKNPNLIFPGQIFKVPEKMVDIDSNKKS